MKAEEGITMVKIAIGILLLCLLLGAVLVLFFFLLDRTNDRTSSMEATTQSSSIEQLLTLADLSRNSAIDVNKCPTVASVVSALSSFNEDGLLFVLVHRPDDPDGHANAYAYEGTTVKILNNTNVVTVNSTIPVTEAAQELLHYSDMRCEVYVGNVQFDALGEMVAINLDSTISWSPEGFTWVGVFPHNWDWMVNTAGGGTP